MVIYQFFMNPLELGRSAGYAEGFLSVIAFMLAVLSALVLHEVAHGYAAYKWGDNTAKLMGRLTLNPKNHIDPVGAVAMLLFGFGWAKPVPVNPYNYRKRIAEVYVALSGVLTNLVLAFIASFFFSLMFWIFSMFSVELMTISVLYYLFYLLVVFFYLAMMLNLCFMLFNILPLYPLDGFRLLEYFIRRENRFMFILRQYSNYILLGVIGIGVVFSWIGYDSPFSFYIGGVSELIINAFLKLWGWVFGMSL